MPLLSFREVPLRTLSQLQDESPGDSEQQQWVQTMKAVVHQRPDRVSAPPTNPCQRAVFELVTSQAFDGFIMAVIVGNIAVIPLVNFRMRH